jgi:hypothetical protein
MKAVCGGTDRNGQATMYPIFQPQSHPRLRRNRAQPEWTCSPGRTRLS